MRSGGGAVSPSDATERSGDTAADGVDDLGFLALGQSGCGGVPAGARIDLPRAWDLARRILITLSRMGLGAAPAVDTVGVEVTQRAGELARALRR